MNRHDSRRSRHSRSTTTSSSSRNFQRCLLAAALCANAPIVTAFGVTSTSTHPRSKSPTALETSGAHAIPMPVATTTTTTTSSHPLELPTFRFPELVEVPTPKQHNKKKKHSRPKQQPRRSTAATTASGTTTSSTTLSSTTSTSSSTSSTSSTTTTTPWNLLQVSSWDESEIQRRKEEWAGRYTSLDALRSHFGANENKLWGDLQASTARRLYKTLLPRALLELSQLGLQDLNPHDLAPLAYQARVAAKLYARERCTVPARIAATLFDGFRQFQTYGTFRGQGMTYDQIWDKYRTSLSTMMEDDDHDSDEMAEVPQHSLSTRSVPEKDAMTTDVCLKILEKSCVSNSGVDRLVQVPHDYHVRQEMDSMVPIEDDAPEDRPMMLARALQQRRQQHQQELLERIHAQLEQDMYELLLPDTITDSNTNTNTEDDRSLWNKRGRHKDHVRLVRLLAKQKRLQQRRAELGLLTSTTPSSSSSSSSQDHESAAVLRP